MPRFDISISEIAEVLAEDGGEALELLTLLADQDSEGELIASIGASCLGMPAEAVTVNWLRAVADSIEAGGQNDG